MKSKFKKLMAAALVLCLVLALLPAAAFANGETGASGEVTIDPVNPGGEPQVSSNTCTITYVNANGTPKPGGIYDYGTVTVVPENNNCLLYTSDAADD